MPNTLILNSDGLPLSLLPISSLDWREAIKLIFLERVSVIHHYDDWFIHSPSTKIQVPSVLMTTEYVKISKTVRFSRYNLFLRDNFQCQYCGIDCSHDIDLLTLDHVIPKSHGGKTTWINSVAACEACNTRKSNSREMKPKTIARKPNYYELVEKRKRFKLNIPHKDWAHYLGWPEENLIISK